LRFLSYGKKLENLFISIDNKVIGSEFSTFSNKIHQGEKVALVCGSRFWGTAVISSEVQYSNDVIWKDKLYPYRAKLQDVKIFKKPISFAECNINEIFRLNLGKQWAYKILFTPGDVPVKAITILNDIFDKVELLGIEKYSEHFSEQIKIFERLKQKRLGLNN
jgi:hypothetical protein